MGGPGEQRLLRLYLSSRGFVQAGLVSLVLALGTVLLAPLLIPVLLSSGRVSVGTAELFGVVPAVVLGATFRRTLGEMEWVRKPRLRRLEVVHVLLAVIVVFCSCFIVAALIGGERPSLLVASNGLAFLGLVLIVVRWNGIPYWSAAVIVVGVTYLLGKNPDTGIVRLWAWLLWVDGDVGPLLMNLSLLVIGALSFISMKAPPEEDTES